MPITPAPKTDRAANYDTMAALILVAWATLRQTRDLGPDTLTKEYQKIRAAVEDALGPP